MFSINLPVTTEKICAGGWGGEGALEGILPTSLKNLAKSCTSANFTEIWPDDMANFINIVECVMPEV